MLIIDSNIWAYYFDEDATEHRSVADKVEAALTSQKIAINTVIIIEVAHFLIKNLGPMIGRNKLNLFLSFPFAVIDLDYDLTQKAIDLLAKYSHRGIGGRDATILATAETLSLNEIMTHDQAFKRVDWLKVIDPIPKQN
ncbi:MAG: type II toxin-antitoxin system VapC family toxin [Candidatus Bathyarchaeia archaeon]